MNSYENVTYFCYIENIMEVKRLILFSRKKKQIEALKLQIMHMNERMMKLEKNLEKQKRKNSSLKKQIHDLKVS